MTSICFSPSGYVGVGLGRKGLEGAGSSFEDPFFSTWRCYFVASRFRCFLVTTTFTHSLSYLSSPLPSLFLSPGVPRANDHDRAQPGRGHLPLHPRLRSRSCSLPWWFG
jgi:hypothetical protein